MMEDFKQKGIFITGTDTGVGKTIVTSAIAHVLKLHGKSVGVMKPIATDSKWRNEKLISKDAQFLKQTVSLDDPLELINPVRFEMPLAPKVAAKLEGREVNLQDVFSAYKTLSKKYEYLVIEGIGGIGVPIKDDYVVANLIKDLDLPLIVVSRPTLGTINHTYLTVKFAQSMGLTVKGVIINRMPHHKGIAEQTNPKAIEQLCKIPIVGIVPYDEKTSLSKGKIGNTILESLDNPNLLDCLGLET
jgi:dethiobiotin synthetase